MLGFGKRRARDELVARFHEAIATASRSAALYGEGGFPDTVEGRFESLTLHVMLVLRRLRELPAPGAEVAQELVDAVFAHLEVALRETGIGDMGVPKRIKALGRTFYDRTARYEAALAAGNEGALAGELAGRLGRSPTTMAWLADYLLRSERSLSGCSLDDLLRGPPFALTRPDELSAGAVA